MISQDSSDRLQMLVCKYDRPGPRYTSYPTAPEWSDQYGSNDYIGALKAAAVGLDEPLSFYLHIPYCRRRCWFCGCNTMVSRSPEAADYYLGRVEKEAEMVLTHLGKRRKVTQFHWGGGTPSFLTNTQTIRAFEIFSSRFDIQKDAEISIELDPRVTTKERVKLLQLFGFNRLSFGIQDFDADVQTAIGRNQEESEAVALYQHSRQLGFSGINFDLIYGLPKQSIESFARTLHKVIELRPDRIALYSYAHLPQGKAHQQKIDTAALPSPQLKFDLFELARNMFNAGGYCQIGMDHFVLPSDELALAAEKGKLRRNFMGYTIVTAKDWIGVGMSAISYINNSFVQNHSSIDSYNKAIDQGQLAVYRGLKLTLDDLIRQYTISELMCNFRVDLGELSGKYGIDANKYLAAELRQLEPFATDGLLNIESNILTVTSAGKIFVRNIAMTFDAYLKKGDKKDLKVQFSRTI
jgi:oxygen-independent coproporphyrinogen-3 oxidase